jgi:V8-like Glu-specific endopeptidase
MARDLEYELESELEQAQYELENEGLEVQPEEEFEAAYEVEPEIIGPDTRVRVTKTTAAPFRYICNLEYNFPSAGAAGMCSGTLIGPSTVLTAGHCIFDSGAGRLRDPARMRVIPGRNGALEPLPATGAAAFRLARAFAATTPTDYGVVHLRNPIGIRIGYWSVAHRLGHGDTIGTSISANPLPVDAGKLRVNLSGYPADKPGATRFVCTDPAQPQKRCKHSLIGNPRRSRLCGTEQWRAYDRTVVSKGGILEYLDDSCPGHSGSPVWVRRDPTRGGRVMIAIHVSGDQPPAPVANRGVRITRPILNNILRWLAEAPVPPPFRILDRFDFDKSDLAASHKPVIEEIARRIMARLRTPHRVRTVYLIGHADSRGSAAYNLALGQRRATAVRTALMAALERIRPGLSRSGRFVVDSLGEAQPIATATTPDGRARNRRVEVMLARV